MQQIAFTYYLILEHPYRSYRDAVQPCSTVCKQQICLEGMLEGLTLPVHSFGTTFNMLNLSYKCINRGGVERAMY